MSISLYVFKKVIEYIRIEIYDKIKGLFGKKCPITVVIFHNIYPHYTPIVMLIKPIYFGISTPFNLLMRIDIRSLGTPLINSDKNKKIKMTDTFN